MKTSTKVVLVIVSLILVAIAVFVFLAFAVVSAGGGGGGHIPRQAILELEISGAPPEVTTDDPFSALIGPKRLRMRDWVESLHLAAKDKRVVALVARITPSGIGFGQMQEMRDAILEFKKSGKPTIAYADTFGEFGPGDGAYYLATAFDEIYIQPSGDIGLAGLMAESSFLRGTFDKLGVVPRMDHRYEYKNAMNTYTETAFTEPHREAMQTILDSLFGQIVEGIATGRGKTPADIRALIDRGPFLGQEALDAGLVDGLKYRDQVDDRVREKAGENAERVGLGDYWQGSSKPHDSGRHTIALIYGVGGVQRGDNGYDPLTGSYVMGGDEVAQAFRDAIDDEDVKAIVFRVDSPGGSYVASDTVWRETVRAKEKGKPVVVSMVDVAGSGGYFVAMEANKIVAQPGTITGSIGVLGGKLLTNGLWDKVGLSFDSVQTSANAEMWSSSHDYGEAEWARFQAWLDRVYVDFTSKVADGRKLPREKVLQIAKGRIWSGQSALEIGLVDELGGFPVAFRLAREAAGLNLEETWEVREFPRPKSPWEEIFNQQVVTAAAPEAQAGMNQAALMRLMVALRPLARAARDAGLLGEPPGVLEMRAVPEPTRTR